MNKGLTYFAMFATGVAIGSVVTWQYTKEKYRRIADEEIESVKEVFYKRLKKNINAEKDDNKAEPFDTPVINNKDVSKYSNKVEKLGYNDYSNAKEKPAVEEPAKDDKPYVIEPDEFGELEDYDVITLTYYEGDDVLTDDCDELLEDPENTVGFDSLSHFGDYEDEPDVVYVRNDRLKVYYQILLDSRTYEEVINNYYR